MDIDIETKVQINPIFIEKQINNEGIENPTEIMAEVVSVLVTKLTEEIQVEFNDNVIDKVAINWAHRQWEQYTSADTMIKRAIGELQDQELEVNDEAITKMVTDLRLRDIETETAIMQKFHSQEVQRLIAQRDKRRNQITRLDIQNIIEPIGPNGLTSRINLLETALLETNISLDQLMSDIVVDPKTIDKLCNSKTFLPTYAALLQQICERNSIVVTNSKLEVILPDNIPNFAIKWISGIQQIPSTSIEVKNKIAEITVRIAELAENGVIVMPTDSEINQIQRHLVSTNGNDLSVISTVCPPYRFDKSRSRFTGEAGFDNELGIVTETVLHRAPIVLNVLRSSSPVHAIGYADFEGTHSNSRKNGFSGTMEFIDELDERAATMRINGVNAGLMTNIIGISREQFWELRAALSEVGNFLVMRQIDEVLGEATNAADWAMMAMIASAQNHFILDGASLEVARKFYARGFRIMEAVNKLNQELSEDEEIRFIHQLENALRGDTADNNRIQRLMGERGKSVEIKDPTIDDLRFIARKIGEIIGTSFHHVGVLYLPQGYRED